MEKLQYKGEVQLRMKDTFMDWGMYVVSSISVFFFFYFLSLPPLLYFLTSAFFILSLSIYLSLSFYLSLSLSLSLSLYLSLSFSLSFSLSIFLPPSLSLSLSILLLPPPPPPFPSLLAISPLSPPVYIVPSFSLDVCHLPSYPLNPHPSDSKLPLLISPTILLFHTFPYLLTSFLPFTSFSFPSLPPSTLLFLSLCPLPFSLTHPTPFNLLSLFLTPTFFLFPLISRDANACEVQIREWYRRSVGF